VLKSGASPSILEVTPASGAAFEDRRPGMKGRRIEPTGMVIADDGLGDTKTLRAHGADIVVADLGQPLHSP
jgi:hypothetical protein